MKVIVYTTPTCPYCRQAKQYLSSMGVPFVEKNVAADHAAAREMVQRSGQNAVPVLAIEDEVIIGFDRPRIDRALAQARSRRPHLGAAVASAAQVGPKYGLGIRQGAYVGRVNSGSVAQRAGIRAGDVILRLGGQAVNNADDVDRLVGQVAMGQRMPAVLWRDGRQMQVEIAF